MLASVAEQAGLSLSWSETPEDMFFHDEAHVYIRMYIITKVGRQPNYSSDDSLIV